MVLRRKPAVSIKVKDLPSISMSVSIASLVVPGALETISFSCPRRALMKEAFPTFGRPITATRMLSFFSSSAASSGKAETIRSKRSPMFLPARAETPIGSPRPNLLKGCTSTSSLSLSTLLATSSTPFFVFLNPFAISKSSDCEPTFASTRKSTRSASEMAISA